MSKLKRLAKDRSCWPGLLWAVQPVKSALNPRRCIVGWKLPLLTCWRSGVLCRTWLGKGRINTEAAILQKALSSLLKMQAFTTWNIELLELLWSKQRRLSIIFSYHDVTVLLSQSTLGADLGVFNSRLNWSAWSSLYFYLRIASARYLPLRKGTASSAATLSPYCMFLQGYFHTW